MKLISINLPEAYLSQVETLIQMGLFPNRSEAIRCFIRDGIINEYRLDAQLNSDQSRSLQFDYLSNFLKEHHYFTLHALTKDYMFFKLGYNNRTFDEEVFNSLNTRFRGMVRALHEKGVLIRDGKESWKIVKKPNQEISIDPKSEIIEVPAS